MCVKKVKTNESDQQGSYIYAFPTVTEANYFFVVVVERYTLIK